MKLLLSIIAALAACDGGKSDAEYRAEVVDDMYAAIAIDLVDLVRAVRDLQAVAPAHAWKATGYDPMVATMRDIWKRTRIAYEHVEGATDPILGNLEASMDARYDDFLETAGASGDQNLFDATGVTGMHAIERILYAPEIRPGVVAFESGLAGYRPAAYPSSDAEAQSFKSVLVQKLVDDAVALRDQWLPDAIDIGATYQGLVGLMNEQREKVDLAARGKEESRYANVTLFDLRNNLEGTRRAYELFRPWILAKPPGEDIDAMIQARFTDLAKLYASLPGDSLPGVPDGWNPDQPTADQLATPFGILWQTVRASVDPARDGSVVLEMNKIAVLLGFPEFIEDK